MSWPTATLDPVRRLHVLADTVPGTALVEREIDRPFDDVWAFLSDVERSVPSYDRTVPWLRITQRAGEHLKAWAGPFPFRIRLVPGFMWMQTPGRLYVVGQAARPLGADRTLIAHLEGSPRFRSLSERVVRRHVEHDLDGIVRRLTEG